MNIISYIILFAYPLVALAMFRALEPRRAVLACFVAALLGIALTDPGRLSALRPRWFDLPMAVWCACPMASSLDNGLGAYDGCSIILAQMLTWGFPYLIGRAYFQDLDGLRALCLGIV